MGQPGTTTSDNLDALPVTVLKGVDPRMAGRLERLGIRMVQDVLFHLPARYEDRTRVVPMGSVRPGDHVVVQGEVDLAEVRFGRRRSLLVRISDGTGFLRNASFIAVFPGIAIMTTVLAFNFLGDALRDMMARAPDR